MVSPGNYLARVDSGTLTNEDKPCVVIQLTITHSADNGEWSPVSEPFERRMYWYLHGKAEEHTYNKLDLLKWEKNFGNMRFDIEQIVVKCSHEEYKGQTKERWDLHEYSGGGEIRPADSKSIAEFNSRYKAFRGSPVPAGRPATPPKPATQPSESADEAPF